MKNIKIIDILTLLASIILLQSLYFKFSAAEESVYIFTKVGMEPFGRIAAGVSELIAAFLLIYRPTRVWGALIASGVMAGAILSHLTVLGIEVMDDGGLLFFMALYVFLVSGFILFSNLIYLIILLKSMVGKSLK